MHRLALSAGFILAGIQAQANLIVQFTEGAPTDRFAFTNAGDCPMQEARITVDLTASRGGLIFDVTETGAGVSVYQPFEVVEGAQSLGAVPLVADGDTGLILEVERLDPGATIAFTIDVDDTAGTAATLVSEAEISGAGIMIEAGDERISGFFGDDATARVALPPCPSA
jgi:hypothetical protein